MNQIDKLMALAADFGADSLRVGSYERKDSYDNNGVATWKTVELREKRERSRQALRTAIEQALAGKPSEWQPISAAPEATAVQRESKAETALNKVLSVIQRYLPPDGPNINDAMSEIIGIVDPWPLDTQPEPPAAQKEQL